jgi:site-specific DNA recombinase
MRACLYFRVSTEEQSKEGFSMEAQRALLDRKCAEWNYTIIKT